MKLDPDNIPKNISQKKRLPCRFWIIASGLVFCALVIGNSGLFNTSYNGTFTTQKARVLSVDNASVLSDPYAEGMLVGTQILEIELLSGEFAGQIFQNVENRLTTLVNSVAKENMEMLFNVRAEDGKVILITMFGYRRDGLIYALAALFIFLLVFIGRKKGVYSAIALIFTLIVVIFFMIPFILKGYSPILLAIVTSALASVFTIFMVSDISLKSFASIAGIVLGVATAGIVGAVAGKIGRITGLNVENAEGVLYLARELRLNIAELLFAGIIIATLGAVMDVSISISSAIFEIRRTNPNLDMRQLYKSGMNIGRDIMGTMSNTLILAFAGSSIHVLIIIVLSRLPYLCLINLNLFAVELIQGISGTIGLILTVPITAACAAALASGNKMTAFFRKPAVAENI